MRDAVPDAGDPVADPVPGFEDAEPDPGELSPGRVPRGWSRADAEMLIGAEIAGSEIAGSVARSEWLRDVRAAQVAREWAGIEEQLPLDDLGMVKWAGQGTTPEAGLVLSAPASVDSPTDFGGASSRRFATASPNHDQPDVTDWLDRLYGPAEDTGPIMITNGVPEYDLGPLGHVRRSGLPSHSANDPGRFRDLVALEAEPPRRAAWPARKSIVLPVAVIVSLAGLGLGRTALEAVETSEQVTLADPPPLLMGQKAPSGTLATVPPAKSTPKSAKTSSSISAASGGKHAAATAPSSGATAQPVAPGTKTPPSDPIPERPRTSVTTYPPANPGGGNLTSSTVTPTAHGKKDGPAPRKGRHRKPDAGKKPKCDPNYSFACVPVASDVDCADSGGDGPAYLASAAKVIGKDIYKLDTNGDGWVCEQW
jgi:hypothetical protein